MAENSLNPLVSIIIAAYQSDRKQLNIAIESATSQSYSNLEILIADDSPSDLLFSIVASHDDARIKYHHNQKSLGVALNHWEAISRSKGEYIAILNHDDWFLPDFVSTLVNCLQKNPCAVLAFCDHYVIDASGDVNVSATNACSRNYKRATLPQGIHQPFYRLVTSQTIPMAMGCIFRKRALPSPLPLDAGPSYDLWLTYLLARGGGGACYAPKRLSAWRCHDGNLTSTGSLDWVKGSARCWEAIALDETFNQERHLAQRNASAGYTKCALRSWRDGDNKKCALFAAKGLRLHFSLKGLTVLIILSLLPYRLWHEISYYTED